MTKPQELLEKAKKLPENQKTILALVVSVLVVLIAFYLLSFVSKIAR
jgi:flagellar biosynthesis/type III secretory pathway M-ring protein FliF/YscJ